MKKNKVACTTKDIESIKHWLNMNSFLQPIACPFVGASCKLSGFDKCKLVFPKITSRYLRQCPCQRYTLSYVKLTASNYIKNYEEGKLQK